MPIAPTKIALRHVIDFGPRAGKSILSELRGTNMQLKCEHRDESSWEMGDLAYDLDDTLETGVLKALRAGMRPGSNSYGAFITAFSRRVRSRQISDRKLETQLDAAVA